MGLRLNGGTGRLVLQGDRCKSSNLLPDQPRRHASLNGKACASTRRTGGARPAIASRRSLLVNRADLVATVSSDLKVTARRAPASTSAARSRSTAPRSPSAPCRRRVSPPSRCARSTGRVCRTRRRRRGRAACIDGCASAAQARREGAARACSCADAGSTPKWAAAFRSPAIRRSPRCSADPRSGAAISPWAADAWCSAAASSRSTTSTASIRCLTRRRHHGCVHRHLAHHQRHGARASHRVSSSPPLPSDEALAWLLFGKPASALSALELLQVAQTLAGSPAGRRPAPACWVVCDRPWGSISQGRSGASSSSSSNSSSPVSLEAGYVAPGVYVGAKQAPPAIPAAASSR